MYWCIFAIGNMYQKLLQGFRITPVKDWFTEGPDR